MATSSGRMTIMQAARDLTDFFLLLLHNRRTRKKNVTMDPQHLLGDCLIHVFTFLTEEDLIRASSVCMVRTCEYCIQHAEVTLTSETTLRIGCLFSRTGTMLPRLRGYGGECFAWKYCSCHHRNVKWSFVFFPHQEDVLAAMGLL